MIALKIGDLIRIDLNGNGRRGTVDFASKEQHVLGEEDIGLILAFVDDLELKRKLKTDRVVKVLFGDHIVNGRADYYEKFFMVLK